MKKALLLLAVVIGIALQGCSPDDDYRDMASINLTSTTWYAEAEFPDRFSCEYWDFYPDGSGEYELYTEYANGAYENNVYYFTWEPDYDFSTIAIYMDGFGWEYWIIDRLTPDHLGVYISDSDPMYYPDIDTYYQNFYALP
ncbi:MAG: hypothetical protein J6A20_03770 [Muribaculaceae bacterium]|nr:hypothetical protein [Muribaculaceae bacterium]